MLITRNQQLLIKQIRKTFEYHPPIEKKRDLYRVPEVPIQQTPISTTPELKPQDSYSDVEDSIPEVESNPSINSQTKVEPQHEQVQEMLQFEKISIHPHTVSKLSELMNQNTHANPMATQYAQFGAKSDPNAIKISMILPFGQEKPLFVQVKGDATVDDVIGYSLFEYVNQKRTPRIPSSMFNVMKWNIRIVDDGDIDEDFPPLERGRKIQKYAFEQFALVPTQSLEEVQEQETKKEAKGGASASVFLKIHLYSTLEVKQTTTMQMPLHLTMQEVFDRICVKRKYDSKDYILKMPDTKTDVPMDKTLEQMECIEFCVLKRSSGGAGDIFLRPPDEPESTEEVDLQLSAEDYRKMFKQFSVTLKKLMGKQERIFTIDGEYIHLDTTESKSLFGRNKILASYPISDLLSCTYSKKNPNSVKIVIRRASDNKVYDLEADPKIAYEISARISYIIEMNTKTSPLTATL